jgi:hypothetical protein
MKKQIISLFLILSAIPFSTIAKEPNKQLSEQTSDNPFQFSPEFILEKLLAKMGKDQNSQIKIPEIRLASKTTLEDFQKDLFPQWGFLPEVITNAYSASTNRIYLLDDLNYYKEHNRCIDDSLAHELTHFIQVRHRHIPIEDFDDSMEFEAIDMQTWFRTEFCHL